MAVVRCLVHDVDAALPFYRALGFRLSGPGTSARRQLKDGSVPEPGGWNRLVLEVADLDATVAALTTSGARFRGKPVQGPGGRQVLVEDPSGNPIELFQPRAEAE